MCVRSLIVEPVTELCGTVEVPGSKNSVQALIAASCLSDETVTLRNVPGLKDLTTIFDMCEEVGVEVTQLQRGKYRIDPRPIFTAAFDPEKSSSYRAGYYFVGALLAKLGRVSIGYPGGDNFGQRPIEQHFKGLEALGAKVHLHEDHYVVEANRLIGADIYFDVITMGGTINLMLAASRAEGTTTLRNAARDPEVVDVANLLIKMGVRIRGAGTDVIHIDGRSYLSGCEHIVIPDRLIAGTYLLAAATVGGSVTVSGVIPEHLGNCLTKLREIGMTFEVTDQSITAFSDGELRPTRVRTLPYPGFPTDLQQPLTAPLLRAKGRSVIVDTVYHRFNHVPQLQRMGANILQFGSGILIRGGRKLVGAGVHATDVRAGACLMLAAMMAEGVTSITGIEHIERGYEDVVGTFNRLGASLRIVDDWTEAATSVPTLV